MIYCFLADGFEEIEALATVDILRRADIDVTTVSMNDTKVVCGSHNIQVMADITANEFPGDKSGITGAIYPGGMPGSETLSTGKNPLPSEIARYCVENDILVGAICAAPIVLGRIGLLKNKNATCYPSFETQLEGANYTAEKVTVDGNIITGRGPGCPLDFAFALVSKIKGEALALEIGKTMQCYE